MEFLKQTHLVEEGRNWGFAVIRPSTAAADDSQWDAAVARLRDGLADVLRKSDEWYAREYPETHGRGESQSGPTPAEIALRKLELPVLDLELEQGQPASLQPYSYLLHDPLLRSARARFDEFAAQQRAAYEAEEDTEVLDVDSSVCIVLDATAVTKLTSEGVPFDDCHIIILDTYGGMIEEDLYHGWMWAQPSALSELYSDLRIGDMNEICPTPKFEGQVPLFGPGPYYGKDLIDPPGGPGKRLGGTRRGKGGPRAI